MIYLIGMPSGVVVGTSLFQITFVSANVTILQAVTNQTVDAMLAILLLVGGPIGAQLGARLGQRLRTEQLRILLALLVLAMRLNVFLELTVTTRDAFAIGETLASSPPRRRPISCRSPAVAAFSPATAAYPFTTPLTDAAPR